MSWISDMFCVIWMKKEEVHNAFICITPNWYFTSKNAITQFPLPPPAEVSSSTSFEWTGTEGVSAQQFYPLNRSTAGIPVFALGAGYIETGTREPVEVLWQIQPQNLLACATAEIVFNDLYGLLQHALLHPYPTNSRYGASTEALWQLGSWSLCKNSITYSQRARGHCVSPFSSSCLLICRCKRDIPALLSWNWQRLNSLF